MNLQENISRIKQVMGLISEQHTRSYLWKSGGLNWYKISSDAKNNVKSEIEKEFGGHIPNEVSSLMWKLFPSIDSTFYKSLISDITNDSLSPNTTTEFKNHMTNYLNVLVKDRAVMDSVKKIGPKEISKVKSPLAKPIIKFYINKLFDIVIPSYFNSGMISTINEFNPSSPESKKFVSKSNKIINQISSELSKDSQLKSTINSIVSSFISKL